MIDGLLVIVHFYDCQESHLNEWNELSKNEPNVHHSYIRCWRKFFHDTDEESGDYKHYSQVDCQGSFKEEWFEEGGGVGDPQQQEGGQVGGQELIGQAALEYNLHLNSSSDISYILNPWF